MTMDGRNPVLRPRTRMGVDAVKQPQGWQGLDPMAQRTLDPTRTFEVPAVYFPADINIPAGTPWTNIPLPQRCFQVAFINLVPNVMASFNGGGPRTILNNSSTDGEITSLQIQTDAGGSCTIQLACY